MAEAFAIVTPERLWRGRFDAPVPGTATSSFGRLTITNGKPAGRHQGADFRAATGHAGPAPNAGRVVMAQSLYFAGNTVIIDHGFGVFSLLAHLSRIDVEPGARGRSRRRARRVWCDGPRHRAASSLGGAFR